MICDERHDSYMCHCYKPEGHPGQHECSERRCGECWGVDQLDLFGAVSV